MTTTIGEDGSELIIPVNVHVNGQTLADIITSYQLKRARSGGSIFGQYPNPNNDGESDAPAKD